MGRTVSCKLACYAAWILGGLMLMLFGAFIVGEGILGPDPLFRAGLTSGELLMLICLGAALLGLIVAYAKPLVGGTLGVLGGIGFTYFSGVGFTSLARGWLLYLLILAGLLHLISWALKRRELVAGTDAGRAMAEPG